MRLRGRSRPGTSALLIAPPRVRPLIRCAAQSDRISVHFRPHTFSVYVLKNMRKRRRPKRFDIQLSRVPSSGMGKSFLRV